MKLTEIKKPSAVFKFNGKKLKLLKFASCEDGSDQDLSHKNWKDIIEYLFYQIEDSKVFSTKDVHAIGQLSDAEFMTHVTVPDGEA